MKIEMDENSSAMTTICVVVIAVGLAALIGCRMCEETKRQAIGAGLIQKPATSESAYWDKP